MEGSILPTGSICNIREEWTLYHDLEGRIIVTVLQWKEYHVITKDVVFTIEVEPFFSTYVTTLSFLGS